MVVSLNKYIEDQKNKMQEIKNVLQFKSELFQYSNEHINKLCYTRYIFADVNHLFSTQTDTPTS